MSELPILPTTVFAYPLEYTYCMILRNFFGGMHLRVRWW